MGTCVSRPSACVGKPHTPRSGDAGGRSGGGGGARRRRSRRSGKQGRRKAPSRAASMETIQEAEVVPGSPSALAAADHRTYSNPAFQAVSGSIEEAWYDSLAMSESDAEDDFHSVQDDVFSLNGFENEASLSTRDGTGGSFNGAAQPGEHHHRKPKSSELSKGISENGVRTSLSHDDAASVSGEDTTHGGGRILDDCGLLPNNCLPCITSAVGVNEKKRALSSSPTHSMKMPSLKLSFKKKSGEAHPSSTLLSTKDFLERPLAGQQVQLCLLDSKIPNSWSHIDPGTFRVRGANYFRDKKKELAPNYAAYYPFGVDVYLSSQKLNHISRFVQLPVPDVQLPSILPPLLVVNVQVPLYSASLFQNETDGEGMSFVLYFRLSDGYSKELPPSFIESIRADNYFEIDIDMHRFSYISRKGFETFLDRLKACNLDVGLTIQGNKAEELPEQILCCVRLNGIDYTKYKPLLTHGA
ncbi:unnamed protein product [Urochloa decumbens]|uniref:Protein ENHANCED DISEASE RESISTANCE 2 C-terminal domain-containing protein n=1 Tax=Urochloa decumbens TaxID=240449 RepID=A0ABC8X434_9POAL